MNKKVLCIILAILIIFLIVTFFKGSKDNFVGLYSGGAPNGYGNNGQGDSCKEQCFAAHPEAARMYADEDNDVASTVIDQCRANCESSKKGCTSCS